MQSKIAEGLRKTRRLLARPGVWVKHKLALTKDRREVSSGDPHAIRFCMVGALDRIGVPRGAWDVVEAQLPARFDGNIVAFNNDRRTRLRDVLRVLDRAISASAN